jgi:integrase
MKNLEQVNHRLKIANLGVQIEQRGSTLSLVATLPPKPNSTKVIPHQQRISLGIKANTEGLKQAELDAKKLSSLLAHNAFSWEEYMNLPIEEKKTVKSWIEEFRLDYFAVRAETSKTLTTWKIDYLQPFQRLPNDQTLTEELLKKVLLSTEPDTRTRRRYSLALCKLADFAGIEHSLRRFQGNYSSRSVSPRSLPSDKVIVEIRDSFSNPQWQLAYGLQATYGLRNHEIFCLDFLDYPLAFINRGKTDERYTYPLFPEWADLWELQKLDLPNCKSEINANLGNRVTVAYNRAKVPFNPYTLRHCWAVRSLQFGLDISLAAAQMGHAVRVHSETYHHWISKEVHQSAMQIVLNNPNRPLPP